MIERMILADNETRVDLLNNEAIAATIVKMLRERPDRPVTLGVHGDWGAGKSSVLEMIEVGLESDKDVLCLKFNGWRFQGFEDAKIVLLEGIVAGLVERRPLTGKAADLVKDIFRRIDWLKVAKKAGGFAFTAATGIPTPDQIQGVITAIEGFVKDPTLAIDPDNVEDVAEEAKKLLKEDVESKRLPEEINEFRKAFDKLLEAAGIKQLVVLVDDLDRCLPDTAIETLEAIRLFVFTARTAFVVAADEAMIEYAVRKHFPDLPDTTGPQSYARNYLEKLIQVPFRIPPLGETETRIYISLLLVGEAIGEGSPEFGKLIAVARDKLKRPWAAGTIDIAAVKAALGGKFGAGQNALALSEQMAPILASGTSGNPRQIKRFLNALMLRSRIAEERGFGDEVKLPILAKLMLAERFMPRLFDQIAGVAAVAPDGKCADVSALEAAIAAQDKGKPSTGAPAKAGAGSAATETGQLGEWLSAPAIRAWARVTPAVGGTDLRPYLFVAKDRKDYFGAASVLGHLTALVEQLLGPKLTVQGLEADLKRLAGPEAAQVFEGVRARILGSGKLDLEPAGMAGLQALVKAHPVLQATLVDFLEGLPRDRTGPWASTGWEGLIKDADAVRRFEQLLQAWSKDGGGMLRPAAAAAIALRGKGKS